MRVRAPDLIDGAIHEPVDQGSEQPGDARQRSSLRVSGHEESIMLDAPEHGPRHVVGVARFDSG